MQLSDYLSAENVAIDLAFNSKKDLLSKLADIASQKIGVDKNVVSKALNAREGLGSTGIGQGVAIPHAIIDGLARTLCVFLRLGKSVDFEAVDDVPVDIIVLLLSSPSEQGHNLNILSCIARRLRDESLISEIRSARSAEEIYVKLVEA